MIRSLISRAFSSMTVPTTTKHELTTRVLPAISVQLEFASPLENDGFTAAGADQQWIEESKKQLQQNSCVGIPTETVYGLAANALSEQAVHAIYRAKSRPSDNPLIVHVSSVQMLRSLYHLPETATSLFPGTDNAASEGHGKQASQEDWPEIPQVYHQVIRKFWPGPLTLVMPRPMCIPMAVLGGHGDTVAFRFPDHPVARAVISASNLPLAAPSANASGRPSPTTAAHVLHDLNGLLPLIVDGGPCDVGVESTVLDAYSANAYVDGQLSPCILRPGGITYEQLKSLGGVWENTRVYKKHFTSSELETNPTTPGMKYRHYAPSVPVHVLIPAINDVKGHDAMQKRVDELALDGCQKIGLVAVKRADEELKFVEPKKCQLKLRWVDNAKHLAHCIFGLLRELDESENVDAIIIEGVDEADEGMAVMNRLAKAATFQIKA